MLDVIFNCIVVLGIFCMFFISPACMSIGLVRLSNESFKISRHERTMCLIPVCNYFYSNYRYSKSAFSIAGFSTIVLISTLIVRFIVMFFMYDNELMQTITIYLFLASCLLFWICQAITIFKVLGDSGLYTFGARLFNAVTVIIGHIQVGYWLPRKMYYYTKKKGNKESLYERD